MLSIGLRKEEGLVVVKDGAVVMAIKATKRKGEIHFKVQAPHEYKFVRSSAFFRDSKEEVSVELDKVIDAIKRQS